MARQSAQGSSSRKPRRQFSDFAPDWRVILTAVLITLSPPPWGFYPLIWVSLIPWFWAIRRAPGLRAAFIQGIWLCFFNSLGLFFWVSYVLHEFGSLPWPIAIAGLLIFGFAGEPQFLILSPILKWLEKRSISAGGWNALVWGIFFALLYAGVDWLIPKLFMDTLGHVFYSAERLRQVADLGGVSILTFLVYLVNDALWRTVSRWKNRGEPSFWPALRASLPELGVAALLCVAAMSYGSWRLARVRALIDSTRDHVQAGVIQANIGDFDKLASERGVRGAAERVLATFFQMSDEALSLQPKPDFLVWPETSYPSTFRNPQTADELARDQRVEGYVRERGVPLLFGGYDHLGVKDFNAFFFLSPTESAFGGGGDLQVYRKNILLLFGEYIPGAETFQFLKEAFPQVGNFGRGAGPESFTLRTAHPDSHEIKLAPAICYEVLFPNYVIGAARKGAQIIMNITNDSWFGPWGEPQLHLALSAFRSIETRLPLLRSTNTGISALILPDGEVTHPTDTGVPQILNVSVPLIPHVSTLSVAWGDWFGGFALVAAVALGAVLGLSRRKRMTGGR